MTGERSPEISGRAGNFRQEGGMRPDIIRTTSFAQLRIPG